jgi:hypothetical protein
MTNVREFPSNVYKHSETAKMIAIHSQEIEPEIRKTIDSSDFSSSCSMYFVFFFSKERFKKL